MFFHAKHRPIQYTNNMAPSVAQIVTSLFIVAFSAVNCLRYGQKTETLHMPGVRDEDYMGKGVYSIVSEQAFQDISTAVKSRNKRDVGTTATDNDGHNHKNSSHIHKVALEDHHYQMIIHWAGTGSPAIVVLTRDISSTVNSTSRLYVSNDYGDTFPILDRFKIPFSNRNATLDRFYNSPVSVSHYVFTDIINNLVFTTTDYGAHVTRASVNFAPRQISMHPSNVNHVLAYDTEDSSKQLWHSSDFGRTWRVLQSDVKAFFWGASDDDEANTIYIQRWSPQGDIVIRSDNFFVSRRSMLHGVVDFQLKDDYMFASARRSRSDPSGELSLYVSHKRGDFVQAIFPYNIAHKDYYIADSSEEEVLVCVYHNETSTHLYVSDPAGVRFTLSLRNVVYFNPDFRNDTLFSLFSKEAFADVYKVQGLSGIYIASKFLNDSFSLYNQASMISYDKGASWHDIVAPSVDATGTSTGCHRFWSVRCSLHLAQNFHQFHPEARSSPILSKDSAVGLILASGSVGTAIDTRFNLYVSNDGGAEWREVFKGRFFYAFGDHGGVIVAVRQLNLTGEIFYSLNEGETWQALEFSKTKVIVYGLLSEPGEETTIFSLFASSVSHHSWLIYKVDLRDLLGPKCGLQDYKDWSPTESRKINCLLGEKMVFSRRRAHSLCYNGEDFDRAKNVQKCECSLMDYECDLGYKEILWSGHCVRDPNSTIDIYRIPRPCPAGSFYNRTKGYRRIAGDKCEGGSEHRYEPDMILCPVQEQDEFMLYTTRDSIHRRSFVHGTDEIIPTEGLENIVAVEFDYRQNCLYLADLHQDLIQRLCLGSSGTRVQETIVSERLGAVESMALDWMSDTLYWVDAEHRRIEIAGTDGSRRRVLITNASRTEDDLPIHIERPRAIALLPKFGYMYWTDWSDSTPCIMFAWMDGTHIRRIIGHDKVTWPNGLAIDEQNHRLYWTDAYRHGVYSSDLEGGDFTTVVQGVGLLPHPYALAIYKDDIYWTDWSLKAVVVTDKYTANHTRQLVSGLASVMDLKILHFASQQGTSPCSSNNGGCSSICVERPHNTTIPVPLEHACLCSAAYSEIRHTDHGEVCACLPGELPASDGCRRGNGTCSSSQMTCANGKCIPRTWRCDRDHDCGPGDDTDELDCYYDACAPGMFTCNNHRCIPMAWKCDHDFDCGGDDHSDEPSDCVYAACNASTQFTCNNSRCINKRWICDGDDDCHDGSDETFALCHSSSNVTTCTGSEFSCQNGACISQSWVCDGMDDCGDNSDEASCHNVTTAPCLDWQYQCHSGGCIYRSWVCDGEPDCTGGDDEDNCDTTTTHSPTTTDCGYRCDNGACVSYYMVCDRINDCGDWSDERLCGGGYTTTPYYWTTPVTTTASCTGRDTFTCTDGSCIPEAWVCDRSPDCRGGEDEASCSGNRTQCSAGYFQCYQSVGCIPPGWVCDGDFDCADRSDEMGCFNSSVTTAPPPPDCVPGQKTCGDGSCVWDWLWCNGHWDCFNGADEKNCQGGASVWFDVQYVTQQTTSIYWVTNTTGTFQVRVMYRPTGSQQWRSQFDNSSQSSGYVLLEGLTPATQYECKVALVVGGDTQEGGMEKSFRTDEGGAVGMPQDVRLRMVADSDGRPVLTVSWSEPSAGGNVTAYKVYMSSQFRAHFVRLVAVPTGPAPSNYELNVTAREQEYLSVEVSAVLGTVEGPKSKIREIEAHVPGRPHCVHIEPGPTEPPSHPAPDGLVTSEVSFSYSSSLHNDSIDKFRIVLHLREGIGGRISIDLPVSQLNRSYGNVYRGTVPGLSPGLQYVGFVQAHNASGYGYMCGEQDLVVYTHGDAIASPMFYVSMVGDMTTSAQVNVSEPAKPDYYQSEWNPVSKIYYNPANGFDFMWDRDNVSSVDVPESGVVTISNLLPCDIYWFRAQLLSPLVSKIGRAVMLKTSQDEKTPPKHISVDVHAADEQFAQVNISFSTCTDPDKTVQYMIIALEVFANGSYGIEQHFTVTVTSKHTVYTMNRLHRGATYNFSVRASARDAKESTPVMRTISPHKAPRSLVLIPSEADALLVLTWKPPQPAPQNYSYGIYHAEDDSDLSMIAKVPKSDLTYVVIGLLPAKRHRFKVRLENVYGYPGEFSRMEDYTTPSEEKWKSLQPDTGSHAGGLKGSRLLAAIIVPLVVIVAILALALSVYVMRHRRLERSLLSYANSHYDTRSGLARFSTDDDEPLIQGFSDDEPLIVA